MFIRNSVRARWPHGAVTLVRFKHTGCIAVSRVRHLLIKSTHLAGFMSANAAMYAMLFLVACDVCGLTMDAGVLAALVAGTFAFSTSYYVHIALGRRGAQDEQDKDTGETGAGDS